LIPNEHAIQIPTINPAKAPNPESLSVPIKKARMNADINDKTNDPPKVLARLFFFKSSSVKL